MSFNDFAARLLRSPFHGLMGGGTLLISVTGRKSGKPVTLPVNFQEIDGVLWVTSRRSRVWWRNLQACPDVKVWRAGKERTGQGELVLDNQSVAAGLTRLFSLDPRLAAALHVRMPAGVPDPADLQREVEDRLLIKLSIKE